MKKISFTFFLVSFFSLLLFSQEILKPEYQEMIKPFWEAVKNDDKEKIISLIYYPLHREYPLPPINNAEEMREYFDIIFDETFINIIKNSSIETDGDEVGWRGITFAGEIWFDYSEKVHSINYQSLQEKEMRQNLIAEMKNNVHESINDFFEPQLFCETESYKIRIDYMGNYIYRLALWSKEKEQSDEPDLVLQNGEYIADGTGGNHFYVFNDEKTDKQYQLYVAVLSNGEKFSNLSIYANTYDLWRENLQNTQPVFIEEIQIFK
jgi:hypothetical protein